MPIKNKYAIGCGCCCDLVPQPWSVIGFDPACSIQQLGAYMVVFIAENGSSPIGGNPDNGYAGGPCGQVWPGAIVFRFENQDGDYLTFRPHPNSRLPAGEIILGPPTFFWPNPPGYLSYLYYFVQSIDVMNTAGNRIRLERESFIGSMTPPNPNSGSKMRYAVNPDCCSVDPRLFQPPIASRYRKYWTPSTVPASMNIEVSGGGNMACIAGVHAAPLSTFSSTDNFVTAAQYDLIVARNPSCALGAGYGFVHARMPGPMDQTQENSACGFGIGKVVASWGMASPVLGGPPGNRIFGVRDCADPNPNSPINDTMSMCWLGSFGSGSIRVFE